MNEVEMHVLEEIRQEVLEQLREKFGYDKVQQVDDLDPIITSKMMLGERFDGLPDWMYEIAEEFQSLIISHPKINIPMN